MIGKVYDHTNFNELLAHHDEKLTDGTTVGVHVTSDGEKRLLARIRTNSGFNHEKSAPKFGDNFPTFPRSAWPKMIADQKAKRRRMTDWQKFDPHDQDGLPTCWANGPAHQFTTQRVIQKLPLVYISACSAAVPISGGHSGGDEWDAGVYFQKNGAASQDVWPNNDTSRSLNTDPKVVESRKHHLNPTMYSLRSFDEFMSAWLMDPPMLTAVAFNWWSHVIMGADPYYDGSNFGGTYRNNWGKWGDANDYGYYGYVTMKEGHGTPDSGYAIGFVTPSLI